MPPCCFVLTVGNPIPETWTWSAPLTNAALLSILACTAWVFWTQLVLCVVVEAIAEIRFATGRSGDWLSRVPGTFGGQQALARTLIQAVVAIGATTTAATTHDPMDLTCGCCGPEYAGRRSIRGSGAACRLSQTSLRTSENRHATIEVIVVRGRHSLVDRGAAPRCR